MLKRKQRSSLVRNLSFRLKAVVRLAKEMRVLRVVCMLNLVALTPLLLCRFRFCILYPLVFPARNNNYVLVILLLLILTIEVLHRQEELIRAYSL